MEQGTGVPRTKPFEVAQLLVLFLTLMAIVWYSIDTHALRKETERLRRLNEEQLSRSYMPFVVLELRPQPTRYDPNFQLFDPVLRNVGFGPAFNIRVSGIESPHFLASFPPVAAISQGGEHFLNRNETGYIGTPEDIDDLGSRDFFDALLFGGKRVPPISVGNRVTITFLDAAGRKHSLEQTIWRSQTGRHVQALITKAPAYYGDR